MSDRSDDGASLGRRTYLKGLAATGLTASLAGCIIGDQIVRKEARILGLSQDHAKDSLGFGKAGHRSVETSFEKTTNVWSYPVEVSATVVSHVVTYVADTSGFGVATTPRVNLQADVLNAGSFLGAPHDDDLNPLAKKTLKEIYESEHASFVLEAVGIKEPDDVTWVKGPTHENLGKDIPHATGIVPSGDEPILEHVLTHGVVRTGDSLRAVVIVAGRWLFDTLSPTEAVIAGASMQMEIEDDGDSESFLEESRQRTEDIFIKSIVNARGIDPGADLEGFEQI